jgi:hypothetical protein
MATDEWVADDEWVEEPTATRLPGYEIKESEPESFLDSAFGRLFGSRNNPTYKDDKGNYVQDIYNPTSKQVETIPEFEGQARNRTTATGMNVIESALPASQFSKIPQAAKFLTRALQYGKGALVGAGASLAGEKASELNEDVPSTTMGEDATNLALNTTVGTALPVAVEGGSQIFKGLGSLGRYLSGKLSNRPKTFEETITPALMDKAMKVGGGKFDDAMAANREMLDLPPKESYDQLISKKKELINEANDLAGAAPKMQPATPATTRTERVKSPILDESGNPIEVEKVVNVPAEYKLATPNADDYVNGITDPIERAKAQQILDTKKAALEGDFEGDISKLHEYKKEKYAKNPSAYNKGLGDKTQLEAEIEKRLASDMNDIVKKAAPGYEEANAKTSELLRLEPTARRREAARRIGREVPGDWANPVDKAAKFIGPVVGGGIGYAGGPVSAGIGAGAGIAATQMGGVSNVLGKGAKGLGNLSSAVSRGIDTVQPALPLMSMMGTQGQNVSEMGYAGTDPQPVLPRDTDRLTSDSLSNFLMLTAQRPDAPIAVGLVSKIKAAMKAQDIDKVEKLHSDMARIFPDYFEPGRGVNGKLFYPEEQEAYMNTLKTLADQGVIDSIQLAEQRNAFNDPQDSRILPVTPNKQTPTHMNNRMVNGTRAYPY